MEKNHTHRILWNNCKHFPEVCKANLGYINTVNSDWARWKLDQAIQGWRLKVRTAYLSKFKKVTGPVMIELFPAPVLFKKVSIHLCIKRLLNYLPTIPTFSPAFTCIDKPLSTEGSSGRYFKTTSLSTICPCAGHETCGLWSGISCGASCSISVV